MQQIERVNVEKKGRHYLLPSGKLVPSNTNYLSILPKPALIHWAANIERDYCVERAVEIAVGDKELFRERLLEKLGPKKAHQLRLKAAGDIGSSLHDMIQWTLKGEMDSTHRGEKPNLSEPALLGFMAWEDWKKASGFRPTHVETIIGSDAYEVGGTVDAAGWINYKGNDRFLVPDWKSSAPSKSAPDGIYLESLIQVAVYREIMVEMGEAPEDTLAGVVRLPKNEDDPCIKEGKSIDTRIMEPEESMALVSGFEHIVKVWHFLKEYQK